MKAYLAIVTLCASLLLAACTPSKDLSLSPENIRAVDILGNPEYKAICYGGYREATREMVPTVDELKDDLRILSAMGVKILRTYNTKQYDHASNLLKAIREMREEDPQFEMYVMLGTWIECADAWTDAADHRKGNVENNTAEIEAAVQMVNEYPDIVKVIAVGNEAMVQWAIQYFVYPNVILKWVNHLKGLRESGEIPAGTWITSSDNFESWGGRADNYKTDELTALIEAVDYISLHTYPFHDTHYNPSFWGVSEEEEGLSEVEKTKAAMLRAKAYAISQYQSAADYIRSLGFEKDIHIGEIGWATVAASSYGATGSQAADEYKAKLFYEQVRDWTDKAGLSCFYFEAFDEKWKDPGDELGSENHFGLIKLTGEAKYVLWDAVDAGMFDGLTRNGKPITKTYGGDETAMMADLLPVPLKSEMGLLETITVNEDRKAGETVTEGIYVVVNESLIPDGTNDLTYPSEKLKLNAWEGTCTLEMSRNYVIEIATGSGGWWGCALEIQGGRGEDLSAFVNGSLHFEIKGDTTSSFKIGFQTGSFAAGTQGNHWVPFGPDQSYSISEDWKSHTIAVSELTGGAIPRDVTAALCLTGNRNLDGKNIYLRNVYYSKD